MFRLVSLLGLAALTFAAVAVATSPRMLTQDPPQDDTSVKGNGLNRLAEQTQQTVVGYHARFSIN
jgi:hypothetical protein